MTDNNGEEIDLDCEYEYVKQNGWAGVIVKICTLNISRTIANCKIVFIPNYVSIMHKVGDNCSFYTRDVIKAANKEERQKIKEEIEATENRNIFDCNFRT